MDGSVTGVPAYHTVMKDHCRLSVTKLPYQTHRWHRQSCHGGQKLPNGKGFYHYTDEEKRLWEETFSEFNYDIRRLALKYPADVVKKMQNWSIAVELKIVSVYNSSIQHFPNSTSQLTLVCLYWTDCFCFLLLQAKAISKIESTRRVSLFDCQRHGYFLD